MRVGDDADVTEIAALTAPDAGAAYDGLRAGVAVGMNDFALEVDVLVAVGEEERRQFRLRAARVGDAAKAGNAEFRTEFGERMPRGARRPPSIARRVMMLRAPCQSRCSATKVTCERAPATISVMPQTNW